MNMDIDSNMKAIGKRFPYYVTYKVFVVSIIIVAYLQLLLLLFCDIR